MKSLCVIRVRTIFSKNLKFYNSSNIEFNAFRTQKFSNISLNNASKHDLVKDFDSIPGPKPSLPFIGTGWQYFKYIGRYDLLALHEANQHKYHIYGPILKEEYQWRKPIIHIFDPKDFETVFRNQGKCPLRPPNEFVSHYRLQNKDKYPNPGLSNMMGEDWLRYRLLLVPALMSLKAMQNHIPSQNLICDHFLNYLEQIKDKSTNILWDLQDATYRLALESICMMCLDSRMQCLTTNTTNDLTSDGTLLISATKRLFESYNELYYGIPFWKLFPTNSYRKLDEAESSIYTIASKYVQKAFTSVKLNKSKSESNETQHQKFESVLQTLIKSDGLTEKDIKITLIDFIVGGIFTVSNTLCFLFYHLAANTDVQQKLFNELNSVMGDSDDVTVDMLPRLPYLKACVKECFRLSCPVPGIMRILPQPLILSGYRIPANTIVFSQIMVTSRLSQYFDDPLTYRPDRWLDGHKKHYHPFSLLPFGYGNRMCAGRRFSELELYLTTAKLIKKYELSAITPQLDFKFCFIVTPAHRISLTLKLRKSQNI